MVCSCIVRLSLSKPSMPIAFNCLRQAQADKGRLLLIAFDRLLMTSILIVHKVVYPSANKIPFLPPVPSRNNRDKCRGAFVQHSNFK